MLILNLRRIRLMLDLQRRHHLRHHRFQLIYLCSCNRIIRLWLLLDFHQIVLFHLGRVRWIVLEVELHLLPIHKMQIGVNSDRELLSVLPA
ncbi:MAG: hypothetical protein J6U28_00810 [Bacteroidales bacterium]|nr:hypothetical protein [Bacteroidales bacterium]